MKLYHYRSINSALIEIENGTFHFSSREELNDPLEGYLRVYWQGDKAAWEGLFRNYIQSLFLSVFRYRLGVEGFLHDDIIINLLNIKEYVHGRFTKNCWGKYL